MDSFDLAKTLLNVKRGEANGSSQTKTVIGVATSDSEDGVVSVDFGGDTVSYSDEQSVEIATTQPIKKGDDVIVTLVGADGAAKSPIAMGVIGRGDELQAAVDTANAAAEAAETAASEAQTAAEQAVSDATAASSAAQSAQTAATAAGQSASRAQAAADAAQGDIDEMSEYFWHDALGAHVLSDTDEVSGIRYRTDLKGAGQTINRLNTNGTETEVASFGATGIQIGEDEKHNVRITETQLQFYNEEGDVVGEMGTSQGSAVYPQIGEIIFTGHPTDEGTSYGTFDVTPEHEPILSEAGQTTNGIKVTLNLIYLQDGNARVPVNSVTVYEPDTEYEMLAAIYYPDVFWVNFYIQYVSASDVIRIRTNPSNGEVYSLDGLIDFEFVADYGYYMDYTAPYYTFGTRKANTNKGAYSVAAGTDLESSGLSAFAEGNDNAASGAYSHAEGSGNLASGVSAHAEGENNTASGEGSHAEGIGTLASGTLGNRANHAEGINTQATGEGSHAEGYESVASGPYSHAGGIGTIANGSGQTVVGQYNAADPNSLFIIGNGTADTDRLNAFQINDGGYMFRRGPNMSCDLYLTDASSKIGQAPSSNKYTAPFLLKDSEDSNTCYIQNVIYANGDLRTDYMTTRLNASGTRLYNGFYQYIFSNGTYGIRFSSDATRDAWVSGLGLKNGVVNSNADGVNVANGSVVTLCNTGQLPAGVYLFIVNANFPSNTSGRRGAILSWTNTGSAMDRYSSVNVAPVNGDSTRINFSVIQNVSANQTVYLRVYQNSGSAMSVGGGIRRILLHY